MASCVKDPQYPGVTISSVTYSPTAVQEGDDITVAATITGLMEFTPNLIYTIDTLSPVTVAMTPGDNNVYTAIIPGQADGAKINFYVEVAGDLLTKYVVPEFTVGAIAIDYSKIRLNELNGNDYDETNGNDKFIELYNAGTEKINLKGCSIYKDDGTEPVWVADGDVAIEAGAYLLLYSKKAHGATGYPANLIFDSGLSEAKPVRIQLMSPANEKLDDFNLITCVAPAQASYSRNADGKWYHAAATPGAANVDGTEEVQGLEGGAPIEPDYALLILNELNGNDKFIELYNANPVAISLEGVYIEKDGGQNWIGDNTVTLEAGAYLVLYSNKEEIVALHPDHPENLFFDGGLSEKKPVRIQVFDPSGTSIGDFNLVTCVIPAAASYSRNADGRWYHAEATPGAKNVEGTELVEGLE